MSRSTIGAHEAQSLDMLSGSGLSPRDRRLVHNALVNSVIEGWTPDADSVAWLSEFAAGKISIDEYRQRVLAQTAAAHH